MKIIYDNIIYSLQKSGGGSVYWSELSKRLNAQEDIQVVFYDQKESNDNLFRKGLKLRNIKIEDFLILKIRRYLNFTPPIREKSIFHSSYFRISKSPNAINVTTIHDFTTEKFRKGIARWVNLQQKKYAVKNSQGIICISENTKKDLLHFFPNTDESKIKVIYNGVSEDFFFIEKEFDIREKDNRFANIEDKKFLLYVGHRTAYKKFDIALDAAVQLKDKYQLVVVGEPFSEQEKQKAEKLMGERCIQLSKLSNEKLNELYNRAFALLYPSSYEGFGIPVIEAMKTGCPVIATRYSSIPEVARDAAILLENMDVHHLKEAILKLENPNLRKELREKGFLQSTKFNWDKTFEEYIAFYKQLYDEK